MATHGDSTRLFRVVEWGTCANGKVGRTGTEAYIKSEGRKI